MKKYFVLPFSLLLLFGCGKDEVTPLPSASTVTTPLSRSFQIKDTSWNISLPAGWQYLPPPGENTPTVLLAQRQSGNFVILQKGGAAPSPDLFLAKAKQDFYSFTPLSNTEGQWSFQGQATIEDPLRTFYQRAVVIPGTDNYLYGSCSHENTQNLVKDCESILKNWGIKGL